MSQPVTTTPLSAVLPVLIASDATAAAHLPTVSDATSSPHPSLQLQQPLTPDCDTATTPVDDAAAPADCDTAIAPVDAGLSDSVGARAECDEQVVDADCVPMAPVTVLGSILVDGEPGSCVNKTPSDHRSMDERDSDEPPRKAARVDPTSAASPSTACLEVA